MPRFDQLAGFAYLMGLLIYVLACVYSPVQWSADGRWIALTRYFEDDDEEEISELWLVSTSPIERRRLMRREAPGGTLSAPAWHPDGAHLYVAQYTGTDEAATASLWRVSAEGEQERLLRVQREAEVVTPSFAAPALSPDGERIAFARDDAGVLIARIDGGIERTIAAETPLQLEWSPDGRWLLVQGDLQIVDTQSGDLLTGEGYGWATWLSGGGQLLALGKEAGAVYVAQLALRDGLSEVARRVIGEVDVSGGLVADDSRAVFVGLDAEDTGIGGIARIDVRSGEVETFYRSAGSIVPWALSPDGRYLAFREAEPARPRRPPGYESVLGVLDVEQRQALYVAVDEAQWEALFRQQLTALEKAGPEEIGPARRKLAGETFGRYLAAWRRDFPQSPLIAAYAKRAQETLAKPHPAPAGNGSEES